MRHTPFSSAQRSASERLRVFVFVALAFGAVGRAWADDVFLTPDEAPAAVFPDADRFERSEIVATPELRSAVRSRLGGLHPTVWEPRYAVTNAYRGDELLGRSIVVEEIGKHRAITFVDGVNPRGEVADVAIMA